MDSYAIKLAEKSTRDAVEDIQVILAHPQVGEVDSPPKDTQRYLNTPRPVHSVAAPCVVQCNFWFVWHMLL